MKIINLRLHYPHCQQDKLVEVSEEVFDVLCQSIREMRNYERRKGGAFLRQFFIVPSKSFSGARASPLWPLPPIGAVKSW